MLRPSPTAGGRWPAFLGLIWLSVVGVLVWLHARESVWPPIYDAFTYFAKAKNVWAALGAGDFDLDGLLAIEPTFRPPGTVLLSYPFGYTPDFRGFYFRSSFFPVALVWAAGLLAAWSPIPDRRRARYGILSACFLSTLSLFFYFELHPGATLAPSHWGLVDGFLTGLSALATAMIVQALQRRSIGWSLCAATTALLIIFVKPSGLVVAGACGVILGLGWMWNLQVSWSTPYRTRSAVKAIVSLGAAAILLGGGALVAFRSAYLDASNLMYGNAAIDVMRAELQIDWVTQIRIAIEGLGPFVPLWIVAMACLWIFARVRPSRTGDQQARLEDLLLAIGVATMVGGLAFWIFLSGGRTFVRYFAPFFCMSICFALPSLTKAFVDGPTWARRALAIWMSCAMVNLILLLALHDPSMRWQTWSGVNVTSGKKATSFEQARALIGQERADGRSAVSVYSFIEGSIDAMYDAAFNLSDLEKRSPRFTVRRPVDWQRPTAYRIEEIVSSDYLLASPGVRNVVLPSRVDNFREESAVFDAWVGGLTANDGIEPLFVGSESVLVRVVDRSRLRRSLASLVAAHQWRAVFLEANPPKWWSEAMIRARVAALPSGSIASENIDFGAVLMREVCLEPGRDGAVELRVWLRTTPEFSGDAWVMLVHFVDGQGANIAGRDMAMGAIEAAEPEAPFWLLRSRFMIPPSTRRIALGFYRGNALLTARNGETDWGGKRFLMPAPDMTKLRSPSSPVLAH